MRNYLVNLNYLSLLISSKTDTFFPFPPTEPPVVQSWSLSFSGPINDIVVYRMATKPSITLLNTTL